MEYDVGAGIGCGAAGGTGAEPDPEAGCLCVCLCVGFGAAGTAGVVLAAECRCDTPSRCPASNRFASWRHALLRHDV